MSTLHRTGMPSGYEYCSLCDVYFKTKEELLNHCLYESMGSEGASRHPRCAPCGLAFLNKNSQREHFHTSTHHFYCQTCDKQFSSAAVLRVHLTFSQVHHDWETLGPPAAYAKIAHVWARTRKLRRWEEKLAQEEEMAMKEDGVLGEGMSMSNEDPINWDQVVDQATKRERLNEQPVKGAVNLKVKYFDTLSSLPSDERAKATLPPSALLPASSPTARRLARRNGKNVKYTCPVCLSQPKAVSVTACGHMFCEGCLKKAVDEGMARKGTGVCPICRQEVDGCDGRPLAGTAVRRVDMKSLSTSTGDEDGVLEA